MRSEEARANGTEADPVASSAYIEHATEYFCVEVVRTDMRNCAIDTFSGAEKCNEMYRRTDGVRVTSRAMRSQISSMRSSLSHHIQVQNQRPAPLTSTVLFPPFSLCPYFPHFPDLILPLSLTDLLNVLGAFTSIVDLLQRTLR